MCELLHLDRLLHMIWKAITIKKSAYADLCLFKQWILKYLATKKFIGSTSSDIVLSHARITSRSYLLVMTRVVTCAYFLFESLNASIVVDLR